MNKDSLSLIFIIASKSELKQINSMTSIFAQMKQLVGFRTIMKVQTVEREFFASQKVGNFSLKVDFLRKQNQNSR